jgi:DNA polymerase-3 subunit delta
MPEITYQELSAHIAELKAHAKKASAAVYLIHGEAAFVRMAFDDILRCILPDGRDSLTYEPIDGASADLADVVASLNTYSLVGGAKVVALRDARLFHTREDAGTLLDGARKALSEGDLPAAARRFISALAQLSLSPEELIHSKSSDWLPPGYDPGEDDGWIGRILEHCTAGRLTVPASADAAGLLEKAIENGFPKEHRLIITTDITDRRRSLFKLIAARGLVVDCSVPKGDRKADKEAQEAALSAHMKTLLTSHGKTMGRAAFLSLCEMTGFEPGTFLNNLQILIHHAGARKEITTEDVEAVLTRTKKDPLYELTNAITDRQAEKALFFLGSLLEGEIHGLQALAAIANQVRKLLMAKDFTSSSAGAVWHPSCDYPRFQKAVMPAVADFDRKLQKRLEEWELVLKDPASQAKKKKKVTVSTDLLLAKNPANAYPVYQLLKKSDRFSRSELVRALESLNEADMKLKSSPLDPRLVLERVIMQICVATPSER